jgi:hypothetical protein
LAVRITSVRPIRQQTWLCGAPPYEDGPNPRSAKSTPVDSFDWHRGKVLACPSRVEGRGGQKEGEKAQAERRRKIASGEIWAYLANGGTLEHAQSMAAHESPRATKLYDRTKAAHSRPSDHVIIAKLKIAAFSLASSRS